jgi:ribonuclease HII
MVELGKLYPQYGLAQHKGYPTKAHLAAIETHGINHLYRKSFAPIKKLSLR